jgi:hypothetical protein
MRLRFDPCGVCKGTPVDGTGLPHPKLSRKLAIEKRRRRQKRFGVLFRGARSQSAGPSENIVSHLARIHIKTLSIGPILSLRRQAWVEFRGGISAFL